MKKFLMFLSVILVIQLAQAQSALNTSEAVPIASITTHSIDLVSSNKIMSERLSSQQSFDDLGQLIESTTFNADGSLNRLAKYKYDSFGNQIEAAFFGPQGDLLNKTNFSYDAQHQVLERIGYNADGTLNNRSEYSYDPQGNQIAELLYDEVGLIWQKQCEYAYDAYDNWIMRTCTPLVEVNNSGSWSASYTALDNEVVVRTIEYFD